MRFGIRQREGWQVYALVGGFCASAVNFHAVDGSGYKFLADMVLQLDKLNGSVSNELRTHSY
jgi:aminopeptidase N